MNYKRIAAAAWLVVNLVGLSSPASAQLPTTGNALAGAPGVVVRRVIMKDALSAEQFKAKLDAMKTTGLFRDLIPAAVPANPNNVIEISFLTSGNYLLVVGKGSWVDSNIDSIRTMAYLFERPRAYLQLNLRVVQLTGPANAEVIQMSETVRALVDGQREEVVRTLAELDEYLTSRLRQRQGPDRAIIDAAQELFPTLGTGQRPLTMPELLLLLMLDRTSPAPRAAAGEPGEEVQSALLDLPHLLAIAAQDPHSDDRRVAQDIQPALAAWKKAVTEARDWCGRYAEELKKGKDSSSIGAFREAIQRPNSPLPSWMVRRMLRSLDLTERLYPNLARRHTQESLLELQRRFGNALDRVGRIEQALAAGTQVEMPEPAPEKKSEKPDKKADKKADAQKQAQALAHGRLGHNLAVLKSLADELVPSPLALFETVATTADNAAPNPQQVIDMLREYTVQRRKLDAKLQDDAPVSNNPKLVPNYARLQALEASLNLWLRRVSEGMGRALEQQFYRRYVNEMRLLANKQLGKSSNRDILNETRIEQVPDATRDLLLADSGVNVFVSNSVSLQFAPDTTNSVTTQVQSSLPSKQTLLERVQQAEAATKSFDAMSKAFGMNGQSIVQALLAGGQAVPAQSGLNLSAMPSIGFDASTVTLSITATQTLAPNTDKVTDRVTNHSINNATVTALSYEPMVLSTLASNISYYEDTGGIPGLRKIPGLKTVLKDLPIPGVKGGKRQKGIYQSSVIILEPVVIPTIEDLVRFQGGWREGAPTVTVKEDGDGPIPGLPAGAAAGAVIPNPAAPFVPPPPPPAPAAAPVKK